LGLRQGHLIAYARINQNLPGTTVYIRRVAVHPDDRKHGIGTQLMTQALNFIETLKLVTTVELDAQYHLQSFYINHGFHAASDPYDDSGILHIRMIKDLKK
jgi:ElaA protein